uniref:UDP-3-O-(3-hydroxymyristoyl)glucosamine N-acyltransferase n=1 Tax=Thaumasiovibrio occultus TaxID=1891184 RepID=UPI000B35D0C3|nr:UDP-3-O-(3-hydroxymyristoyl)glucosamine N-acyltransferase [Thaumasiovibrio occultus]
MFTVLEVAKWMNGEVLGDGTQTLHRIVELTDPTPGGLAIVRQPADVKNVAASKADAIIGPESIASKTQATVIAVKSVDVAAINRLLTWYKVNTYRLDDQGNTSSNPDVYIGKHTTIGEGCYFMPGVRIMNGVTIGKNVAIHANTVIKEGTVIGDNVTIDSNCSIGNYSFEYLNDAKGRYVRLESIGRVIIGDDVEIGANNTIDRGTIGNTVIGEGTKIDNHVQIGHDVKIGKHCLLISQVGIAGWTTLEDRVIVHGQAGLAGGLTIGRGTLIKGQAGVTRSCPAGSVLTGYPAREHREFLRMMGALKKLSQRDTSSKATVSQTDTHSAQESALAAQDAAASPKNVFSRIKQLLR